MSFTTFQSKATFLVSKNFNLDAFIQQCHDDCIKDENFIWENYGMSPGDVQLLDLTFSDYISLEDEEIVVSCDTEESNSDSEVFVWLTDRFAPLMVSKLMRIEHCTDDSRSGMSSDVCFMTRDRKLVSLDDLLEAWQKVNS